MVFDHELNSCRLFNQVLSFFSVPQIRIECGEKKSEPSDLAKDIAIKSATFRMKTECQAEVKEKPFKEFDAHEQIGMDFITSKDFDALKHESIQESKSNHNQVTQQIFTLKHDNTDELETYIHEVSDSEVNIFL
jgi:hypothetical protein